MKKSDNVELGDFISCLPELAHQHARTTKTYQLLDKAAIAAVATSRFTEEEDGSDSLGPLGTLSFPYTRMGAVDSLDLFGLDELIIFAFYYANRDRYRSTVDIGANIGLHSIVMSRCGWNVTAYEPDPTHADLLDRNLRANNADQVKVIRAAVSDRRGEVEFVRVLGNTTSSHLAGAKSGAYGDLQRFPVCVEPIGAIISEADFVKVDAEGEEARIILGATEAHWARADMMAEIGSVENAQSVFQHMQSLSVNGFAQRLGWQRVTSVEEMPVSYRDGSIFLSRKSAMPWA